MAESTARPPGWIITGQVKCHLVGAHTFRFSHTVSGEEASFCVWLPITTWRAGRTRLMFSSCGKKLQVSGVEFSAKRSLVRVISVDLTMLSAESDPLSLLIKQKSIQELQICGVTSQAQLPPSTWVVE
jgi:hypothetical protein